MYIHFWPKVFTTVRIPNVQELPETFFCVVKAEIGYLTSADNSAAKSEKAFLRFLTALSDAR